MDSSIPLLTPFTSYSKWKLKMIASLKRWDLYELSIGLGKESYENENDWLNDSDRDFGAICLALSPSLYYLIGYVEYPKDLWTILEPLASTMRIIIALWRSHPAPQDFFTKKFQPLLSLMKLFKMKMKQNLLHIQFELKKVSMQWLLLLMLQKFMRYLISHLLILLK